MERILEPTGIPMINKLHHNIVIKNTNELVQMLETDSMYYKGKIEGTVISKSTQRFSLKTIILFCIYL